MNTKEKALTNALNAVLSMDVKGHQLRDRLQFSTEGRHILNQCNVAFDYGLGFTNEDKFNAAGFTGADTRSGGD